MALFDKVFEDLTDTWEVAERYTASVDVDVLLSNTSAYFMFFVLTENDTPPSHKVRRGHLVAPMRSEAFQLKANERLWVAGGWAHGLLTVS